MNTDPLSGKPSSVLLYYAIPSTVGLLALSSAALVDAIFVGNFAGAISLAAVNLSMPAISFLFAIAFMLAIGGSVLAAKYLGEKDSLAASDVFSKIILLCAAVAVVFMIPGLLFIDSLVQALGSNEETHHLVRDYLLVVLVGAPVSTVGFALYYFVMTDNRPMLACAALVAVAAVNIALDWLLVAVLRWDTFGAALATILSHIVLWILLLPHFFSSRAQIRFRKPVGKWRSIYRAILNGFSELVNELSAGIITLMFNWILISRFGTEGVAAFTVVGYMMVTAIMLSYGMAEGAQPLVSKNLGAKQFKRIYQFFYLALFGAFICNLLMSLAMLTIPDQLISVFLREDAEQTIEIARQFALYFWPVPVLIGFNIVLTGFFTATNQPLPSAIISVSRSLLLPAILLLSLPVFLGDKGIFLTVPVSELIALVVALFLMWRVPALTGTRQKR